MISCKEVVRILSSSEELTVRKKIELKAHLFICKHCSGYLSQLNAINEKLKNNFELLTKANPEKVQELEDKVIEDLKCSKNPSGES